MTTKPLVRLCWLKVSWFTGKFQQFHSFLRCAEIVTSTPAKLVKKFLRYFTHLSIEHGVLIKISCCFNT